MRKPNFNLPTYPYTRFAWKGGHGAAEASGLGIPAGAEPGGRVWNDACDVGFIVRGETTDKLFIFERTYPAEREDPDSAVDAWLFRSEDGKHTVTVEND